MRPTQGAIIAVQQVLTHANEQVPFDKHRRVLLDLFHKVACANLVYYLPKCPRSIDEALEQLQFQLHGLLIARLDIALNLPFSDAVDRLAHVHSFAGHHEQTNLEMLILYDDAARWMVLQIQDIDGFGHPPSNAAVVRQRDAYNAVFIHLKFDAYSCQHEPYVELLQTKYYELYVVRLYPLFSLRVNLHQVIEAHNQLTHPF